MQKTTAHGLADNSSQLHSAATNATNSHLLRLPAEIRERIWCLVLGGYVLHVASGPVHTLRSVIMCAQSDDYNEGPPGQVSGLRSMPFVALKATVTVMHT